MKNKTSQNQASPKELTDAELRGIEADKIRKLFNADKPLKEQMTLEQYKKLVKLSLC